jgi:hypothetical protein
MLLYIHSASWNVKAYFYVNLYAGIIRIIKAHWGLYQI